MFVSVLVADLREHGAASTSELTERLTYTGIRLPSADAEAIIEYARRHGLVEPLGQLTRADGSEIPATEWRLTEKGLKVLPPLSEADASRHEDRFRRWIVEPLVRFIKPLGLATLVAAAIGATALPVKEVAVLAIGVFALLFWLVVSTSPLRTRVLDWVTLAGWPYYAVTYDACRDQLEELRSRRKLGAVFRLRYMRYWTFTRRRAELINNAGTSYFAADSRADAPLDGEKSRSSRI